MHCQCSEAYIDYQDPTLLPVPTGVGRHDCSYVDYRNSLIAKAEKIAYERYNRWQDSRNWSLEFHRAMNRLVKEAI